MATSSEKPTAEKATKAAPAETAEAPSGKATVMVDSPEAHTDRVAAVSRTKDGEPDQGKGYEIIVPEKDKRAAENRPEDWQPADGSSS